MALHISEQAFEKVLEKSTQMPVLIDFFADWCAPCKMMAPIMEELATEMEGKAVIGKMDVDEAGSIAQQFGIRSIPTLILFKDKKEQQRIVGLQRKEALKQLVESYL